MCFSIAADALCCAGVSICQCACCCCKSCFGTTFKEQTKLAYIILNLAMMVFTVICLYWIDELFSNYMGFVNCPASSQSNHRDCIGVSAVYRMSFVLMWLYAILILCMLARGEIAKQANEDFWTLKLLFIAVFFFGSLYIPNSFFVGYVQFARIISIFYLIFQIIMLIDVFYLWGQSWIGLYEAGNEYIQYVLIGTTLILYSAAITLNSFNFIWFKGCSTNVFMNVFTLMLTVIITVVQLLGWNPKGSLICSGAMSIYIVYQAFMAQASGPDCNSLISNPENVMGIETGVGFFLLIVALIYLTFATQESSSKVVKLGAHNDLSSGFLETQQQRDSDLNKEQQQQEQQQQLQQPVNIQLTHEQEVENAKALVKKEELAPYETNQYLIFHIVMFVSVIYMAMMITNWGAPDITTTNPNQYFQPSNTSYWVAMSNSWIAALIYIWTLVAPHIFPDRDF